jgi:hypothetical protein
LDKFRVGLKLGWDEILCSSKDLFHENSSGERERERESCCGMRERERERERERVAVV